MTAYLLLIFLLPPDGNITAVADPQLYIGADLCMAKAAEATEMLSKQDKPFRVTCVDSRMSPGVGL